MSARQILRSATSIGANYRAACRAKSAADMILKQRIVEEESDETIYRLEVPIEGKKASREEAADPVKERGEIPAMTIASIKTLRAHNPKS